MANGGMGGGGVSDTPAIPSDLEAIYQGGAFFLDRMKAMSDAREAAEKALADLKIGNDIVGARTAAVADVFAATSDREEAAKVLSEAKDRAAKIVNAAQARADGLADTNAGLRQQADDYAAAMRRSADDYAINARNEADAARKEAERQVALVAPQVEAAQRAEEQFRSARAEALASIAAATDMQKSYADKLAQIQMIAGGK